GWEWLGTGMVREEVAVGLQAFIGDKARRAIIVRRYRKEQHELASCRGRLFVQHIEKAILRAGHVELETPARLEYLPPGRLKFCLVRLAVAVFLHGQKVAQVAFG